MAGVGSGQSRLCEVSRRVVWFAGRFVNASEVVESKGVNCCGGRSGAFVSTLPPLQVAPRGSARVPVPGVEPKTGMDGCLWGRVCGFRKDHRENAPLAHSYCNSIAINAVLNR